MTREQAAVELAKSGLSSRQIAERMGIKPVSVSTWLTRARRNGDDVPINRTPTRKYSIILDAEDKAALDAEAAARGMNVAKLSRQILSAVLRDNLIDAVLDD